MFEMVFMVSTAPVDGRQSMGQRTPFFATAWNASNKRRASNTERPTVKLLRVAYLTLASSVLLFYT